MEGETDRAALVAKWLAVLLWLTVPQGLSILLLPLRFGGLLSLPGLLSAVLPPLCLGTAAWALWQLTAVNRRFGLAARWQLASLVPAMVGAVFGGTLLRLGGAGLREKPMLLVLSVLLLLIAAAAAIGTRYQLCLGMAETIGAAEERLSGSWRGLWRGTLWLMIATVAALPLSFLSLPLALMIDMLTLVGFIVLQITFLVRLYETVRTVRVFATEGFPPEEVAETGENEEENPDNAGENQDIADKIEEISRIVLKTAREKWEEIQRKIKK